LVKIIASPDVYNLRIQLRRCWRKWSRVRSIGREIGAGREARLIPSTSQRGAGLYLSA